MHVTPEQLLANLEALDPTTLEAKLRSGGMTPEAAAIAHELLAARGVVVEAAPPAAPPPVARPEPPPAPLPGGRIVKAAFVLYLLFLLLCTVAVIGDPPWSRPGNGTWEGMIGSIATFGAGFPWTYLYFRSPFVSSNMTPFLLVALAGVVANVVLFTRYLRRT